MKQFAALVLLACLLLSGCGKKAPSPAPVTETAPAAAATLEGPVEGIVDPFMTAQLQIFIRERGRMPVDFNEFASARMDSVPMAPEGTRFVVDPATRQVKLTRIK